MAQAIPSGSRREEALRSTCLHTAAAANRASHIADWAIVDGIDELVYASHKNLVFAKKVGSRHPPASQVVVSPRGYLTVVKYAHSLSSGVAPRVIAASSDGYLHLYSKSGVTISSPSGWTLSKSWAAAGSDTPAKGPSFPGKRSRNESTASIQALGVLRPTVAHEGTAPADCLIFASAASDGVFKVWKIDERGNVELKQSATLGKSRAESKTEVLPLDIAISALPTAGEQPSRETPFLMAVAGTDGKVDFWLSEGDLHFKRLFAISGHSDWIRSLDFCSVQETDPTSLMLATGSQDHSIRLWRVERNTSTGASRDAAKGELDEFDRLAMQIEDNTDEETIATKAQSFSSQQVRWDVSLDALLSGHEHWVTGVRWAPLDGKRQPAALLSSSADNSVILWTPSSGAVAASSSSSLPAFTSVKNTEQEQDIWVSIQRFGELGSVGSAANGMYGVLWDPTLSSKIKTQAVLAHGYGGALQIWGRSISGGGLGTWKAQSGLGGHFAPSTCVRWEPGGEYYITGGLDKTTRLYGCYRGDEAHSWHEMARPQTHGFEIVSLAWLSRLAFSSAGDEKIIRVLEAPQGFVQTMQTLSLAQSVGEDLLAFGLPTLGHLLHPDHLDSAIEEATRLSLARRSRLTIAAISPLFDGLEDGKACKVSFEAAENFLKGCYAKAWGVAIKHGNLLFEIDVLFVGSKREEWLFRRANYVHIYSMDEPSCRIATVVFGEGVSKLRASGEAQPSSEHSAGMDGLPQHRVIALGGTFDHLHVGHKILLSMAALCATAKIIVGVTDDSMLTKKKSAHLLEDIDERIRRVSSFLATFRAPFYDLESDVVKLQDVAGPAGTVADIDALLFTDETISGADFIDKEREKNGLNKLERLSIGVIGAQGETDMKGKDASELAAAKVGSTAIRQWLDSKGGKGNVALDQVTTLDGQERPVGASVPPLGLSNRSIYSTTNKPTDGPSESGQPVGKAQHSIAHHLTRPPVEDELHNNSLWCEVTKLYGHSLELLSLDVSVDHGLIASSCKAKSGQLAVVLIHDRNKTWDEIQQLDGHALDITRVRFSPDGRRLVSVSRDRSWRLYTKQQPAEKGEKEHGDGLFSLSASLEEAHTRIIYDVAWTLDSTRFATASRDHHVKVWTVKEQDNTVSLSYTLPFAEAITALAFTKDDRLAVGSEKGNAYIYDIPSATEAQSESGQVQVCCTMPAIHSESISELAWRPAASEAADTSMLVSSSLDGSTRLWQISS